MLLQYYVVRVLCYYATMLLQYYVIRVLCCLSSTYKCNFLGADNKQ